MKHILLATFLFLSTGLMAQEPSAWERRELTPYCSALFPVEYDSATFVSLTELNAFEDSVYFTINVGFPNMVERSTFSNEDELAAFYRERLMSHFEDADEGQVLDSSYFYQEGLFCNSARIRFRVDTMWQVMHLRYYYLNDEFISMVATHDEGQLTDQGNRTLNFFLDSIRFHHRDEIRQYGLAEKDTDSLMWWMLTASGVCLVIVFGLRFLDRKEEPEEAS